ncbi:hypothetical protein I7I50_11947 [Histoplasma capsulatum G186AR]|uniref:Uncharacterized protein n=1 Tax=Ajellomyces capsulatus TaxID=5037 RepID=A0A8H8CT46_AJECA|nr:hypothetical protein I7I52_11741 [Histoplasma capsulatum]QSS70346.1 hypothetical protein I7I50_11947 [Histoplasma capsulatum G186AR]
MGCFIHSFIFPDHGCWINGRPKPSIFSHSVFGTIYVHSALIHFICFLPFALHYRVHPHVIEDTGDYITHRMRGI